MIDALVRAVFIVGYRVMRVWWFFRRPSVRGAFVAVWHDDSLLLIRNSYRAGETLPCGRIERGETARAAARRELREEVGIDVAEEALAAVTDFEIVIDYKHDHASVFELHPSERPAVRIDAREVIWGEFVHAADLANRPLVPHLMRYLEWRRQAQS